MQAQLPTGTMDLQFAAGILLEDGFETGPKVIFRQLRDFDMMTGNRASRQAIAMAWLYEQHGSWNTGYGEQDYVRVFITRSGVAELERRLQATMPIIMPQQPIDFGMTGEPLKRQSIEIQPIELGIDPQPWGF